MKKIVFTIIACVFMISVVNAYECTYDDDFVITFNDEGKAEGVKALNNTIYIVHQFELDSSLTDEPSETPGVCSNVKKCEIDQWESGDFVTKTTTKYMIFSDSLALGLNESKCMTVGMIEGPKDVQSVEEGDNDVCPTFNKLYNGLKTSYINCSSSDCVYNTKKDQIVSLCNSVFKNMSYDDKCLQECLKLKDRIFEEIENASETDINKCGLSQKLLVWILNIIKWVKYIVPVLVILFGMVDFIRAVLSEKDDEMKKAQGRFVRRLIAAALIFIVPLVLTFILEKMGFSSDMCNISF